jgi:hypothetical protein
MRCLHVIDTLRPSPIAAALAALLATRLRASGDHDVHDVLAFSGGSADDTLRARARRLFVAGAGLDVAAIVHARAYDVVHALDVASAHRIGPMILASSATPFVYSGRALAPRRGPTYGRAADESLSAAADLTILDAAADAVEARQEPGGRLVRLDLAGSGLVSADDDAAPGVDTLPPGAAAVLRDWLACLARAAAA